MAFRKLTECDRSDLNVWASQPACKEFVKELRDFRETALRALIKSPTEANASDVRAYDRVLALIEECHK